jgi:ABC-type branched-subunit amino acid transport system ATPase component
VNLLVDGLSAGYGSAVVVRDVSFDLQSGKAFAFLGRNGMGKTTLAKAILGYLKVSAGSVQIDNQDVTGLPTHRIQRLGVGYGPQEGALFADLSVAENLRIGGLRNPALKETRARILANFPVLEERLRQRAGTLSGGEQKMLTLARALISEPDLVLLDEISEGLQPSMVENVRRVLDVERRQRQMTILLVEQNIDFALSMADRVAMLQIGRVLFEDDASANGIRDRIVESFAL